VCEHDIDYRDYAESGVAERSQEVYATIRSSAEASGLVDIGVPERGKRSKDPMRFVWGRTRKPRSRSASHGERRHGDASTT
jgi:hypothetical protein